MTFLENDMMKLYGLSCTALALHLLILAAMTGGLRTRAKAYVNPEDARTLKGSEVDADAPVVQRAKRAHMNAIENFVPFVAIGFFYALTGPGKLGAEVYFGVFVAARVLHSIFYMMGLQPWRTAMFGIGAAALTGMGLHVIRVLV